MIHSSWRSTVPSTEHLRHMPQWMVQTLDLLEELDRPRPDDKYSYLAELLDSALITRGERSDIRAHIAGPKGWL